MARIVSPSLLSADFGHLADQVEMLNRSRAEWIHLDIMDGVFVPNLSFGFPVVKAVRALTDKVLDVHLMIVEPDRYISRFREFGADMLTVQVETCTHLHRTIQTIHEAGMKAGVSLNPHTPLCTIEEVLGMVDMVLLMTVNPGFGGQKFIPRSFDRIRRLREMMEEQDVRPLVQVDGGVTTANARVLYDAGVDVLVAGNTVFSSAEPEKTIDELLRA